MKNSNAPSHKYRKSDTRKFRGQERPRGAKHRNVGNFIQLSRSSVTSQERNVVSEMPRCLTAFPDLFFPECERAHLAKVHPTFLFCICVDSYISHGVLANKIFRFSDISPAPRKGQELQPGMESRNRFSSFPSVLPQTRTELRKDK